MATIAQRMLRDALDAFVRRDTELAQHVLNEDDRARRAEDADLPRAAHLHAQDPATIEPALDLILVSRHLERIGDHATNIAEDVIFIVSARDVRHHAARRQLAPAASDYDLAARLATRRAYKIGLMSQPLCVFCRRHAGRPAWRPFCSERCKLQDLARWADGTYRVAGRADRRRRRTTDDNLKPDISKLI